jgi:hypothetical protein
MRASMEINSPMYPPAIISMIVRSKASVWGAGTI